MSSNATNSDGDTLTDEYRYNGNNVRGYGYGNYYTWSAAMASTKHYSSYKGANGSDSAGTSICPKGWEMPLGYLSTGTIEDGAEDADNRVGSFSYLDRKMGGTGTTQSDTQLKKWLAFPNNYVLSGWFNDNSVYPRGTNGFYWSRSVNNSYAYSLRLSSGGSLLPGTTTELKSDGKSVRCIAQ